MKRTKGTMLGTKNILLSKKKKYMYTFTRLSTVKPAGRTFSKIIRKLQIKPVKIERVIQEVQQNVAFIAFSNVLRC